MSSTCKCIIDGFKMRGDLDNLRNSLLEGRPIHRFIDSSINTMNITEIDCGINLNTYKTNIQEIKSMTDSGKILMAVGKLDDILSPNSEKSLLAQLNKC